MRILRKLLVCGSAAALTGGLALTAGAASGLAATHRQAAPHTTHHLSAQYRAEARAALVKYLSSHALPELVHGGQAVPKAKNAPAVDSYNWSGYVDAATNAIPAYNSVSADWTTPAVTCGLQDSITAEWVGLDGFGSSTVEQDGTIGWCFQGTATYYTWWEMYPAGSVAVGSTLAPGDAISASVSRTGITYRLAVTDTTTPANSFVQYSNCSVKCVDASAEWIAERPALATTGIAPLANYGTWTVTNARESYRGTPGNISAAPSYFPIDMQDSTGTYDLSTPGGLAGGGSGFTTTWLNSY